MSERGVFAVDRGVFEHPVFAPEPYTEREAWLWMIGAAAWKPMRVRSGRHMVEVERGQLAFATRFLAAKFQWAQARVVRFLKRLENESMIVARATHETTHVTICNYDKYAFNRNDNETHSNSQPHSQVTHKRLKEEELKELKEVKERSMVDRDATRPLLSDPFEDFWKAYPKRLGTNPRQPAKRKFVALVKSGTDAQAIIVGAQRYARSVADLGQAETPYVKQAIGWLNAGMWGDYAPTIAASATGPPGWQPGMPTDEELRRKYANGTEKV